MMQVYRAGDDKIVLQLAGQVEVGKVGEGIFHSAFLIVLHAEVLISSGPEMSEVFVDCFQLGQDRGGGFVVFLSHFDSLFVPVFAIKAQTENNAISESVLEMPVFPLLFMPCALGQRQVQEGRRPAAELVEKRHQHVKRDIASED